MLGEFGINELVQYPLPQRAIPSLVGSFLAFKFTDNLVALELEINVQRSTQNEQQLIREKKLKRSNFSKKFTRSIQRPVEIIVTLHRERALSVWFLTALNELDQGIGMIPVEFGVMNKFCEFEIFSRRKGTPRFIDHHPRGIRLMIQAFFEVSGAEGLSTFRAVRVIVDHDVAVLHCLIARSLRILWTLGDLSNLDNLSDLNNLDGLYRVICDLGVNPG